jgi:sec-independent protein translocase protein TatA
MPNLGASELLIISTILLVLFGGSKLPKLAHSIGAARREFERGQAEGSAADAEGELTQR